MQKLPLNINLDTIETLKLLVEANNKIGELKGKAISIGWNELINNGFISTNIIKKIHNELEPNKGSIRKLPDTIIKNIKTEETIFTPPQKESEILDYLNNLEYYLNNGNERTGRIINILYLVLKGKLDYPILYLFKYINGNRQEYYQLLKKCNKDINEIHSFIQYMLKATTEMSIFTIVFITTIVSSIDKMTYEMKKELQKLYSKN